VTVFIVFVVTVFAIIGYVANIFRMFAGFGKPGAHIFMRLIGIFLPPLGVIAGYIPNAKAINT
jgi:hypothetical protein